MTLSSQIEEILVARRLVGLLIRFLFFLELNYLHILLNL